MHNNKNFTNNGKDLYPCTFICYDLMDCTPNNSSAQYTITDHSDDDDYLDEHEDRALEIHIPSRLAAFQLIHDINLQVNQEITSYATPSGDLPPTAPYDDASSDIMNAIDACQELIHYDQKC